MLKRWKKGFSLVMALAMLASAGSAISATEQVQSGAENVTVDVTGNEKIVAAADSPKISLPKHRTEDGNLELTVMHLNDTHGRVGESDVDFAKVAGQAKELRAEGRAVLLLDSGDTLHGRPISNLFEGYSIIEIYNVMGFDAIVPGNHDFNYGWQRLHKLAAHANFPFLSANTMRKDSSEPLLNSCMIREFNGYRVGVFGLSTPETVYKSHPDNTDGIVFADPIVTAIQMTKYLKDAKCDYIIALGHIGLEEGTEITSEDICNAVPDIDLFVDGHSHTKLEKGLHTQNGLIVSANEYANFVGMVEVTLTPDGHKSTVGTLLDSEDVADWPIDEATKEVIDRYAGLVDDEIKIVIGAADIDLIGEREIVRQGDSNLGRIIVDAMRDATGADIALNNGGNVRSTIPAGDITYGDLLEVMPFGNIVVTKRMTGADIRRALEQGVSEYPAAAGGFLHISGGSYEFDPSRPAGSRVKAVYIDGERIKPSATYIVATNDFLAAGGDGSPLGNGTILASDETLDAVVRKYIQDGKLDIDDNSRVMLPDGNPSANEKAVVVKSPEQEEMEAIAGAEEPSAPDIDVNAGEQHSRDTAA